VIQRVDPGKNYEASVFCTLPNAGKANQGVSGFGVDARFGPQEGPFAGKFFAVTAFNNTIYHITADGGCKPFVNFDGHRFGSPAGLGFTADGKDMLVTVAQEEIVGNPTSKGGAIVRVTAEGKINDTPVVKGLTRPRGLALAPQEFGSYAGQIFVADIESIQVPVPMTQALQPDGKVYRVTSEGQLHLVASGFLIQRE
jgi:sugar lactone lactonase YvrE